MGDERGPKSTTAVPGRESSPDGKSGLAAIEQYGWGEKDPTTGYYEGYDLPKQVAHAGAPIPFREVFEQWPLVEFSFAQIGIDLEEVWHVKSWRWFKIRLEGLLTIDSPLSRFFAPEPDPQPLEATDD